MAGRLARRRSDRVKRWAAALLLSAALVSPEPSVASEPSNKSLDAMSPGELERFVQKLNEDANWRKYRRPGDPPDFVPGKPVRVMVGAGAAFGGGARSGGSFRRSGLGSRRSALGSRRRDRDDATASDRSRSSLGSSSRSRTGSSFGSSSRSGGFSNSQRVEQGDQGFE